MPKADLIRRTDQTPQFRNGEIVTGATLIQVTQLALTSPFAGDFQIVNNGRLIVGESPDVGARVIIANHGLFGWGSGGINTFGVYTTAIEGHNAGDWHAGNRAANYIAYDHVEGTLGLYSPSGAGFLADRDGSLRAGDGDGAHMLWNSANRTLEIRNGTDVKISLADTGDATFDGTVYAAGGRIYGDMQVDSVLRAGDVDGPAVYVGKFERYNDLSELVESSEIIATDANNLPWFHVVAGGDTAAGGWFQVGNPGDYQQRMTYDGSRLTLDGEIYARGGEIIDLTLTGDLNVTTGSINLTSVTISQTGIVLDATIATYNGDSLKWTTGGTDYLQIGTTYELPTVTGTVIASPQTSIQITSGDDIKLIPGSGDDVAVTGITKLGDGGTTNYAQFDATGTLTFLGAATITPRLTTTTKTADYVATASDCVIVCNKSTAMKITLPAATGSGQWYIIKSIGAGAVTVDGDASETIDGETTQVMAQWDAMQIVDYATGAWVIV